MQRWLNILSLILVVVQLVQVLIDLKRSIAEKGWPDSSQSDDSRS